MTEPSFQEALERLMLLLRTAPGAGAQHAAALQAAQAALGAGGADLVAGVESSEITSGHTLKDRLLARRVDCVRIETHATGPELLELARALADDTGPFPDSPHVKVELIPVLAAAPTPSMPTPRAPIGAHASGIRPKHDLADLLAPFLTRIRASSERGDWPDVVTAAERAIALEISVEPAERREFRFSVRRALPRQLVDELITYLLRHPESQARAAEILRWIGVDAAEAMGEVIEWNESVGPRRFLFDVLATMPESQPMLTRMLDSPRWYEVRHGAELLGRLGRPDAITPLAARLGHAEARVRQAVVLAFASIDSPGALERLREALRHESPETRAHAAEAAEQRGKVALVPDLLALGAAEAEPGPRRAQLVAAARLGGPKALTSILEMALKRKTLLRRDGLSIEQRLDAVAALAAANTPESRRALDRIGAEAEGQVQAAAEAALAKKR
jgi:HEAT repeat protein